MCKTEELTVHCRVWSLAESNIAQRKKVPKLLFGNIQSVTSILCESKKFRNMKTKITELK